MCMHVYAYVCASDRFPNPGPWTCGGLEPSNFSTRIFLRALIAGVTQSSGFSRTLLCIRNLERERDGERERETDSRQTDRERERESENLEKPLFCRLKFM